MTQHALAFFDARKRGVSKLLSASGFSASVALRTRGHSNCRRTARLAANIAGVARLVAVFMLGLAHSFQAASLTPWDHSPKITGAVWASSSEVAGQIPTVEPLAIWCPSPLLTSFDGKAVPVTLTPKVTGEATPITTTCSPASGSLFPVGNASFTCSAVDALQQKAACRSTVVVMSVSAQPPTTQSHAPLSLTCPTIAPVMDTGSGKTAVRFADPTFSGGTAPVTASCSPRSGSQFSVGTTTVSCQATDATRQTASCKTSATVLPGSRGDSGSK